MLLDVLQWTGAIFILIGYFYYGRLDVLWGSLFSGIGCAMFVGWSVILGLWGITFLNFAILAAILWNLRRAWKKGAGR